MFTLLNKELSFQRFRRGISTRRHALRSDVLGIIQRIRLCMEPEVCNIPEPRRRVSRISMDLFLTAANGLSNFTGARLDTYVIGPTAARGELREDEYSIRCVGGAAARFLKS